MHVIMAGTITCSTYLATDQLEWLSEIRPLGSFRAKRSNAFGLTRPISTAVLFYN
jgi:hypothetical protein